MLKKYAFLFELEHEVFYVEKVILTKFIYAYFKSNFLVFKLPKFLDKNSVLLRTSAYQSSYHLNFSQKSRIYFALEINDFIELNAPMLLEDGWTFIKGNGNVIEILTSDVSEDIVRKKGNFKFYDCIFSSNMNPKCKEELYKEISGIKMSIFYKDIEKKQELKIKYNFMDFDSLHGSMHLLILEPKECEVEKHNLSLFNDNVNNFVLFNYEYLPTFNMNIAEFKNLVHIIDFELVNKPEIKINFVNEKPKKVKEYKHKRKLILDCEKKQKPHQIKKTNSIKNRNLNEILNEGVHKDIEMEICNNDADTEDEIISLSYLEFILREMRNSASNDKINKTINLISNKNEKDTNDSSEIDVLSEKYNRKITYNQTIVSKVESKLESKNNLTQFDEEYTFKKSNNKTREFRLGGDVVLSIDRKNEKEIFNVLEKNFNVSSKRFKGFSEINISKDKQELIEHYIEKNYTSPKIRANAGGCLFALDRFGNLFLKKIGKQIDTKTTNNSSVLLDLEDSEDLLNSELNRVNNYNKEHLIGNKNNNTNSTKENKKEKINSSQNSEFFYDEYKWSLIKTNVKYFDLSENVLLTMGFDRRLEFQLGISQESQCVISKKRWKNLRIDTQNKIEKFSVSSFDCLWLYDDKNILHFVDKFSFFEYKYDLINPTTFEDFRNTKIKNIQQYMDKLFVITRENKIYIKNNIFNFPKSQCIIGDRFELKVKYNFKNSNKNAPFYNETPHNIIYSVYKESKNDMKIVLDITGKLWYRRYVNEILPDGEDWSELKYFEGKFDQLRKFLDFDINFNNIYAINANSKVLIIKNIDVPRLYDK